MSLIRVSAVFNWRPFEGFQSFAANAERANEQIVDLTLQRNINEYLRPMEAIDPGPSRHGGGAGRWSTNAAANRRAQKWYWMAVNKGLIKADASGRYIRSGGLNRQWRITRRGNRISLENTSPKAKYVMSMAETVTPNGGVPNPGHIDTGWSREAKRAAAEVVGAVVSDVSFGYAQTIAASVGAGQYRVVAGNRR
jgi:hypothetical protein